MKKKTGSFHPKMAQLPKADMCLKSWSVALSVPLTLSVLHPPACSPLGAFRSLTIFRPLLFKPPLPKNFSLLARKQTEKESTEHLKS